jgi:hypothetical protein
MRFHCYETMASNRETLYHFEKKKERKRQTDRHRWAHVCLPSIILQHEEHLKKHIVQYSDYCTSTYHSRNMTNAYSTQQNVLTINNHTQNRVIYHPIP